MALLEIIDLSFRYPGSGDYALQDVTLSVKPGEFVVLCGPSGSGKSSLLSLCKKELRPHGEQHGTVRYTGRDIRDLGALVSAQEIGMVMQDPDNQIVMDRVLPELAFSLENVGTPPEIMRRKIAELVHFFGMEDWLERETHRCSGGQKQLINLASVLLLQPRLLLLDEPTAQLDPVAAKEFLQLVKRLNDEFGMTIVLSEHRLDEALPLADRVVVMDAGRVAFQSSPRKAARYLWGAADGRFREYVPTIPRWFLAGGGVEEHEDVPLTVKEGRARLVSAPLSDAHIQVQATSSNRPSASLLEVRNLHFRYGAKEPQILHGLNFSVGRGDIAAILGGNGSGKSTLLKAIAGLLVPQDGTITYNGTKLQKINEADRYRKIGYLAQDPMLYFGHETVWDELLYAAQRVHGDDAATYAESLMDRFQLNKLANRHPYDLSGGEKQKTALAGVLASEPELLLLDEPTKGIDPEAKAALADMLSELRTEGVTIVLVTHDVEFAARTATRCAMLFNGSIAAEGEPETFFTENMFYTTALHRLMRHAAHTRKGTDDR